MRSLLRSGAVCPINGRMRDEMLTDTMFWNLAHARAVIATWTADDNTERTHSALDCQTPPGHRNRPPRANRRKYQPGSGRS